MHDRIMPDYVEITDLISIERFNKVREDICVPEWHGSPIISEAVHVNGTGLGGPRMQRIYDDLVGIAQKAFPELPLRNALDLTAAYLSTAVPVEKYILSPSSDSVDSILLEGLIHNQVSDVNVDEFFLIFRQWERDRASALNTGSPLSDWVVMQTQIANEAREYLLKN